MKEDKKKEMLARIKVILPGIAKVVLAVVPSTRSIGLIVAGSVAVFSLAFPSIIDEQTRAAIFNSIGF